MILRSGVDALAGAQDIFDLTRAATAATFCRDGMTPEEIASRERVVAMCAEACAEAAQADRQQLIAAYDVERLAGYLIATVHAQDDREIDWLMVHPDYHGSGVAARLTEAGIAWLGEERPMWLAVLRHNIRAIRFYRRFGFEMDAESTTSHLVPHWVMRRPAREKRG
jgi:ribosomal protein S18 acetylase RimI-like enzyme